MQVLFLVFIIGFATGGLIAMEPARDSGRESAITDICSSLGYSKGEIKDGELYCSFEIEQPVKVD